MRTSKRSHNDKLSDLDLVHSVLNGDNTSFVALMQRYRTPVIGYCYRFLGNYQDALDIAQDAFVRAYNKLHTFRGDKNCFRSWIFTIAANLSRSELRRTTRYRHYSLSGENPNRSSDDEMNWEIPDENYMPDKSIDNTELAERIQKSLMALSPKFREALILRDIQEISYEEIAEILELPIGTVRSRISRARAQLQISLRDIYEDLFSDN